MKRIYAADLFCGAGGTSTGLSLACEELGVKLNLTAVNHWPIAVATHTANHPDATHFCEPVDAIRPHDAVPGRKLNLLVASPECTHHSRARGGRPKNDQSRASAWHILRWAESCDADAILIENVREFRDWGPLDADGKAIKSRKGETYRAFLNSLRSLGYTVEDRIICAANYGDATSRERLFIQARKFGPITWPTATHTKEQWRAAREVIDWKIKGQSIFNRKRPLAPKTMERIIAGLRKFGGKELEPFLVVLRNHCDGLSVDGPVPTITAGGNHVGVAQPFLVPFFGERKGQEPRTHSVDEPLPAVTSHGAGAVVQPFILPHRQFEQMDVDSVARPLRTVTAAGDFALVEPYIVPIDQRSQKDGTKSVRSPLGTITTKARFAVAQPFLQSYYGNSKSAQSVDEPLDTVTTKDRFALVEPIVINGKRLDIRFRMLQPHELAAAMGFADYKFTGSQRDQVKQIGNAVAVNTAKALCGEILRSLIEKPVAARQAA